MAKSEPLIQLGNGTVLNPFKFSAERHYDPKAFAKAKSQLSRFNGNTRVFYSVLQHEMVVSQIASRMVLDRRKASLPMEDIDYFKTTLMALMHDDIEVLINDIPSPIKKLPCMQPVVGFERDALMDLYLFHGIEPTRGQINIVHEADAFALSMEVVRYMDSSHPVWKPLLQTYSPDKYWSAAADLLTDDSRDFEKWQYLWIERYGDLINKIRKVSDV